MKIKPTHVIVVAVLIAIAVGYYLVTPKGPGKYDEFAQCLTEKDTVMFGTFWCPHCNNQKALFGSSFKYINYVECDPKGKNANPELCRENNVETVPLWIINGTRYTGEQSLQELSLASGCPLS